MFRLHTIVLVTEPVERWREGLKAAVRRAGGPSAVGPPGFDVQLRRWMRADGPKPQLSSLIELGGLLGEEFTLDQQVRLLSPDSHIGRQAPPPEPLRSRRLLLTKLWYAVSEAVQGRPVTADLVQAVLNPADGETQPEFGRWRARQFDVPTGVAYKHVAFRAVEFQRGPQPPASGVIPGESERSDLVPPWDAAHFKRVGADLDELIRRSAPWIRQVLTSGSPVYDTWPHPQHSDFQLRKGDAYDRLELGWRLRALLPLASLTWYGELGALHRGLLYNAHTDRVRHIALVRAYGQQSPDPAENVLPEWFNSKGHVRLILISPPSAASYQVCALLAEAWAWQFIDTRDLVGELTGERPGYDAPDRQRRFLQVYRELSAPPYADTANILLLRDVDTITEGGSLRQEVTDLLMSPGCFTLLLQPARQSTRLWKERQASLLPRGTTVSGPNDPDATSEAMMAAARALEHQDPEHERWTLINWNASIPWWPESLSSGSIPPFWDLRIGDLLLRAAYGMATRFAEGRLPDSRTRKPAIAPSSLLGQFGRQLSKDKSLSGLLEEPRLRR